MKINKRSATIAGGAGLLALASIPFVARQNPLVDLDVLSFTSRGTNAVGDDSKDLVIWIDSPRAIREGIRTNPGDSIGTIGVVDGDKVLGNAQEGYRAHKSDIMYAEGPQFYSLNWPINDAKFINFTPSGNGFSYTLDEKNYLIHEFSDLVPERELKRKPNLVWRDILDSFSNF